ALTLPAQYRAEGFQNVHGVHVFLALHDLAGAYSQYPDVFVVIGLVASGLRVALRFDYYIVALADHPRNLQVKSVRHPDRHRPQRLAELILVQGFAEIGAAQHPPSAVIRDGVEHRLRLEIRHVLEQADGDCFVLFDTHCSLPRAQTKMTPPLAWIVWPVI